MVGWVCVCTYVRSYIYMLYIDVIYIYICVTYIYGIYIYVILWMHACARAN